MYHWIILKRKLESVLMFPFVSLGWVIASFERRSEFEIFFFFPFHHVGGAEKVHYQIAQAFAGHRCVLYFTRKSKGQSFLNEFRSSGAAIRDVSAFTDKKLLYPLNFIFRGIISQRINRQRVPPVVFNGQSNFGYKISPWIKTNIRQADLIHALCSFSFIRIPYLTFYHRSLTVSQEIVTKHNKLYERYSIPKMILERLGYIDYGIELPPKHFRTEFGEPIKVLYVGRGSEEKRIDLIAEIAKQAFGKTCPITFSFLGDVKDFIPLEMHQFCHFFGAITVPSEVDAVYRAHDVLLVTSSTESGPLVAMEAMARGLAVLATPVGIINQHVKNGINGFVFSSIMDRSVIVSEALDCLSSLLKNPDVRRKISETNIIYAYASFGLERFEENYRQFLLSYVSI